MSRARLSIVRGSDSQPGSQPAIPSGSPVGRVGGSTFSANLLLPSLGRLAARVGHADFYEAALDLIGGLVSCDRRLVMRYSRFDRPGFIVNQSLPANYEASYLDGLYRFDPLFRVRPLRRGDRRHHLPGHARKPAGRQLLRRIFCQRDDPRRVGRHAAGGRRKSALPCASIGTDGAFGMPRSSSCANFTRS